MKPLSALVPVARAALVALVALAPVACGKSQQPQTDATPRGAPNGTAPDPGGSARAGDPVSVKDLIALLPAPLGWDREKPTGERITSPIVFASASVRMMKGDATVTAKITDSARNDAVLAPFATMLSSNDQHATAQAYQKPIQIGGAPAFEKWDRATMSGNLMMIVAGRFIVEIDGSTIDDPAVLHDILGKMDLKKLAATQ
jgi:hypothetical protein